MKTGSLKDIYANFLNEKCASDPLLRPPPLRQLLLLESGFSGRFLIMLTCILVNLVNLLQSVVLGLLNHLVLRVSETLALYILMKQLFCIEEGSLILICLFLQCP